MVDLNSQEVLERKLNLERIVANIGRGFIKTENIQEGILLALKSIGQFSNASRAYIFQLSDTRDTMDNTYEWCNDGVTAEIEILKQLDVEVFSWWLSQIEGGALLNIKDVAALDEAASAEKTLLQNQGIRSVLVLPLINQSKIIGFVGFDNNDSTDVWTEEDETILSIASDMFSQVFERLHMDETLKARNEALSLAIEQIEEARNQMIRQEHIAAIGQLAAGVAHEINNPLSFVMSNQPIVFDYIHYMIELIENNESFMKNDFDSIKFKNIKNDIKEIEADVKGGLDRVTSIVKSLRHFSNMNKEDERYDYNVTEGIKETMILLNSRIQAISDVKISSPDRVPLIKANSGKMNQVLLNLFTNALDAIAEKGNDSLGVIQIIVEPKSAWLLLKVKDNGIGIKDTNISQVFNPFYTSKQVGKGTGLGLSLSHEIICNDHGGKLMVESEYGVGTEFIIELPYL